jgi:L-fuconolactonase
MIIDSHCHAWTLWPYQPPVPDPTSRALAEQLLFEMDVHGVDQALIVCAEINHNPDNNHYIGDVAQSHPDRLFQVIDVDSMWKTSYHQPGAAERLRVAARTWRSDSNSLIHPLTRVIILGRSVSRLITSYMTIPSDTQ